MTKPIHGMTRHKGFDSGPTWYGIIDVAAVILIVSSITGMITLLALRARRRSGFIVGFLGVALIFVVYLIWVPRWYGILIGSRTEDTMPREMDCAR